MHHTNAKIRFATLLLTLTMVLSVASLGLAEDPPSGTEEDPPVGQVEHPPALIAELDKAIAFRDKGDAAKSYQALRQVIDAMEEDDLPTANSHLKLVGLGSLETLLFDLRDEIAATADWKKLRGSKGLEARLLVVGLYEKIDRTLNQVDEKMLPPAIQLNDAAAIKDALEKSASVPEQMALVQRQFDELNDLGRHLPKAQHKMLASAVASAVDNRFAGMRKRIQRTEAENVQRQTDLHFRNIEASLKNPFEANAPLGVKLEFVIRVANSIEAMRLQADRIAADRGGSKKDVERIYKRLAPLEKEFHEGYFHERKIAYDLDAGIRWWLRGRFGKGVAKMGLLKELPGKSLTLSNLVALPLLMPDPIPPDFDVAKNFDDTEPVASFIQAIHPTVTRRHLVLWGCFTYAQRMDQAVEYFVRYAPAGTLEYAYFADKTPEIGGSIDIGSDAVHIVGFIEYQMALAHFERMLKSLTLKEIQEVDEWVEKDPRLQFYSCVSRLYDPISTGSALRDPFEANDGDFVRSGLRWIMALARVELVAMEIGAQDPDAPLQKTSMNPDRVALEYKAYRELLWDAARCHFYCLRFYLPVHKKEGTFKDGAFVPKGEYPLIKQEYEISLGICQRFHDLVAEDKQFTPAMNAELGEWIRYLEEGEARLNGLIAEQRSRRFGSKYSTGSLNIIREYKGSRTPDPVEAPGRLDQNARRPR